MEINYFWEQEKSSAVSWVVHLFCYKRAIGSFYDLQLIVLMAGVALHQFYVVKSNREMTTVIAVYSK